MDLSDNNLIYRYWGKAEKASDKEIPAYHLLAYHCLDVAAAGNVLIESQPNLLKQFSKLSGIDSKLFLKWSSFLLAIHDVGKFADGFQNLRPDLFQQLQKRSTQVPYNERHDTLGYRFCLVCLMPVFVKTVNQDYGSNILEDDLVDLLKPWFSAVTGHHGRPPKPDILPQPIQTQFPDQVCKDTLTYVQDIFAMFLPNGLPFQPDAYDHFYETFNRISWLMAGLAVAADWIGSNKRWFPYNMKAMPLAEYWEDIAIPQAVKAVAECGLTAQAIAPSAGMNILFPDIAMPTPLQRLVEEIEINTGPQLFIIEEVTGGGKTEAALTLAHRLMAKGVADGLFMALPTMATANAMHTRVQAVYRKLFSDNSEPSLILAHSASQMTLDLERKNLADKGYGRGHSSASQDCNAWLADSRKKALLAHVGVGTIDQALLAILAVRHQSLRLLGLASKLLLVDEVHACDAYVHRLLCTLLQFHAAHGNSAILLSATLPRAMRAELIRAFSEGARTRTLGIKNNAYPLLTHFSTEDIRELPVEARTSISGPVDIQPLHSANEVHQILREALEAGGCACWVRNTVLDALETYREWVGILGDDKVILFHARFALSDRLKIERDVIRYFGPNSKEEDRRGRLLIATQVVEQSLDLDFDFMVSDLAPIDLLIQRAGRLHRHARGQRNLAILGVYMPEPMEDAGKEWFKAMFPKAAWVYKHHGQLWLTATWLCERKGFSMPDDAREMIERVYGDESQKAIPKDLILAEDQTMGQDMADRSLASLNSLKLDDGYRCTMTNWQDDAFAPTRLGEPTVTVRLARLNDKRLVPWFSENTGHDWELSQLSIRESQIASEDPNYLQELVAASREVMPDEGRYCVVIPMKEGRDTWRGQALNSQDQTVDVIYNSLMGLEVSKGGNA